jgi:serine phosphatase RsbU (regulator of sigma subunit)
MNINELEISEKYAFLLEQNEKLKAQLMSNSMIYELTKVLHSCTDQASIIKTVLLGIQEIINFNRVILFEIDKDNFCLKPSYFVGIKETEIKNLTIPLTFEGGEITDSIFLNKHLIVDQPDKEIDTFAKLLNSPSYLVIPLISKVTRKCWEVKKCDKKTCSAFGSYNPYCWSIPNSGELLNTKTENDKRKECIKCTCFKAEGVFWMDRNENNLPITSDDITTLSAVINQAGLILENFKMYNALEMANKELQTANITLTSLNRELQIAQAKINADLEHARTIQQGLLPQGVLSTKGFSAGAKYIPEEAVGGDYFDIFEIENGIYGIVVADVSGHGISSALIMSMVKVLLKTHAVHERSPQKTLEIINNTFLNEVKTDNFVTIFYAILDTNKHIISYTSAGHCPVLMVNKQTRTCTQIKADGLFLGIFPDMMLHETSYPYTPGTIRFILYTDGLTEARNSSDDMFEIEHLISAATQSIDLGPNQAAEEILKTQKEFCGEYKKPEDDITLLIVDL